MKIVYYCLIVFWVLFAILLSISVYKAISYGVKIDKIKSSLNTYVTNKQAIELDLIARVINQEVTGCNIYDKLAVASSILNRVDDGSYGSSIYDVIYKKHQYAISNTFTQIDLHIAYSVHILGLRDCEVKYFFNPKTARSKQMKQITSSNDLKFKTKCHEYY